MAKSGAGQIRYTTYRKSRQRKRAADVAGRTAAPAGLNLAALDGLAGFFVRMIQLRMFQRFHARFGKTGLNPGAFCALVAIAANPGVRAGALGDALLIKRPNMTKLADSLERQGLIRRLPSDLDRRSVELRLTEAGRARVAATMPQVLAYEEATLAPLSLHERRILLGLLGKLNDGLAARTAGDG